MIEQIDIKQYRKLKNISFNFSKTINVISGTNGTCKTSLLHIVSNAFQAVPKNFEFLSDSKVLDTIKSLNKLNNPKIESLTRGDNEYNDPAPSVKGTLFTCKYFNNTIIDFRKHNSPKNNRFAIKPKYSKNKKESLPIIPIIYLGLFRLYSFGEFNNDDEIKDINRKIPELYLNEIKELYKDFTGIEITYKLQQDMGGIKNRAKFISDKKGIDSNTISAGEDNLFIILTALTSLKYYFESLNKENTNFVESILLIDELDATLHPAFQIRLFDLFKKYSELYKIQIFFTTHSISLLEYALKQKEKVVYLIDNIDNVAEMEAVDKYKIEMFLKNKSKQDIYLPKKIPILTEDEEARIFLKELFEAYSEKNENFKNIANLFHLVDVNMGSQNLIHLFNDDEVFRSTMNSICILDGDQQGQDKMSNHIILLPGDKSPEMLFFDYLRNELLNQDEFWNNEYVQNQGFSKVYVKENIIKKLDKFEEEMTQLKEKEKPTKGKMRENNKNVFNDNLLFFKFTIKNWLNNKTKEREIKRFFKNLNILFKKVSHFHGINPKDWNEN